MWLETICERIENGSADLETRNLGVGCKAIERETCRSHDNILCVGYVTIANDGTQKSSGEMSDLRTPLCRGPITFELTLSASV